MGPEGKRVLLVEDELASREVLAKYLRRRGYRVTALVSAEQVVSDWPGADGGYEVLISDVHLPGMSGLDLASAVLARSPLQPVVLITADPDEALAREALSRGPVSYLLKPFELFELEGAVQGALARRAHREELGDGPAVLADSPLRWLELVDRVSYAGAGHADRVARVARCLLLALPSREQGSESAEVTVAAWSHELGMLRGASARPSELATQSAVMLRELQCSAGVARLVLHMHERWDGSGGPDGLRENAIPLGSQVLAVADSLDHYAAAWAQTGLSKREAADRALGLIAMQSGSAFAPAVVRAAERERTQLLRICSGGPASASQTEAA